MTALCPRRVIDDQFAEVGVMASGTRLVYRGEPAKSSVTTRPSLHQSIGHSHPATLASTSTKWRSPHHVPRLGGKLSSPRWCRRTASSLQGDQYCRALCLRGITDHSNLWRCHCDLRPENVEVNLVSFALRRPITILVLAMAVVLAGLMAIGRMPRDVFPNLGIPVLYVAQPYGGMDPAQMEGYLINYYEYHFLYITGIEHVESKSIQGAALMKLQFHPGTDMAGRWRRRSPMSIAPAPSCRRAPCRRSSCDLMPAACRWAIWSSRARPESHRRKIAGRRP